MHCIFFLLSNFLYLCFCKLQAVAIEKAASQLSIHIPILTFFVEWDDREALAKRTFLQPVPLDSDMNLWVIKVWKKLSNKENSSFFVARVVILPGTNKKYLQPGRLFFEKSTSLLKIQWYECEKLNYTFPDFLQIEFIPDTNQLPRYDDDYLTHSPFIFSRSL